MVVRRMGAPLEDSTAPTPFGQRPVPLTKGEYTLLVAFLEAANQPLSREYLQRATRIHEDIFDRSVAPQGQHS
ncbi:hypothetical protein DNR46_33955 [Mesorhizobium japonicum]|uniref:OmpR/PhoB-type domain-containing protein n=1 Tax=Mesorhizobium japonicum TaxID=2066070 RepID=A0A3M9X1U5_9HYPH|nr:hypothetical protein DNR46_33955 [Mesorhizobium japonicum]